MAKGARSNSQKQLRTWKRQKLVPKWQQEADERRYAALAEAATSAPVPGNANPADAEQQMEEDVQVPARGRSGKQPAADDAMDEDMPVKRQGRTGKGKGAVQGTASGGIKKKGRTHKIGKLTMIGKTEFGKGSKRKDRK